MSEPTIREQLVDGATRLITEEGMHDLSVRTLATSAGRSTMCLYSKFGNRQALLAAVHDEALTTLLDRLTAAQDPADELWAYIGEQPRMYDFLFGVDPGVVGLPPEQRASAIARLLDTLGRGRTPDEARLVWASLHGHAQLAAVGAVDASGPRPGS